MYSFCRFVPLSLPNIINMFHDFSFCFLCCNCFRILLRKLSYAERLANLKPQSLEHRRLIFDLVLVFKIIHGISCLNFTDFFSFANNNNSSRGHPYRLCIPLNKNNTRNFFFSSRVVPAWNSLPASTVAAPNPISFKKALFKLNLSKFLEFPSVFAL